MCVILVCDKKHPSEEMVAAAFATNPSGGGLAWRETRKKAGKDVDGVCWRKGLDLEQMQEAIPTLPLPFIAHFRIPSAGGATMDLCHPFPIHESGFNGMAGWLPNGRVLFHNGTWAGWKSTMLESVVSTGKKLPAGRWSDTRAMAWLTQQFGDGILDFIDEKVIVYPAVGDIDVFGSGWDTHDGILVSNKYFVHRQNTWERTKSAGTRVMETVGGKVFKWNEHGVRVEVPAGAAGGSLPTERTFPGTGSNAEAEGNQQEAIQQNAEGKAEAGGASGEGTVEAAQAGNGGNKTVTGSLAAPVIVPDDLSTWLWAAGINKDRYRNPATNPVTTALQIRDRNDLIAH